MIDFSEYKINELRFLYWKLNSIPVFDRNSVLNDLIREIYCEIAKRNGGKLW